MALRVAKGADNWLFLTHTAISHNNPPRPLHNNDQQIVASYCQSRLCDFAIVAVGTVFNFAGSDERNQCLDSIRKSHPRLFFK